VLDQLEQHMHTMPPSYLPIVVILRASGWRISDVLNLRYDTCLEHTTSGFWLCGDIPKTQVLNHKVPLSDEIAALVAAQMESIRGTPASRITQSITCFRLGQRKGKGAQSMKNLPGELSIG
jgi:hypothetical protein